MDIRPTDLSEPEVVALLHEHFDEMMGASPASAAHVLDVEALRIPEITTFAAWAQEGALLAMGALRRHEGFAEIKSMRAHRNARRTGAGRAMLDHLLTTAREWGYDEVKLETGSGEVFEPARMLYESSGFTPCAPFAGYKPTDFNNFYSRKV